MIYQVSKFEKDKKEKEKKNFVRNAVVARHCL